MTGALKTPIADMLAEMFAAGAEPDAIIAAVRAVESCGKKRQVGGSSDAPRRAGTRLPDDWQPSERDIAYALDRAGMTRDRIAVESEKFQNYWCAKSGKDATKLDWHRTWETWCLNAMEWRNGARNNQFNQRIPLPDLCRPERMPSLPAWVASRLASLKIETQRDPVIGKYRPIPTLPASLILDTSERDAIAYHVAELETFAGPTPADDQAAEEATLVVVTKIMLALPSQTPNEASAEARGEAFMMALDDVPTWAVAAAARRWYRGDAGKNERGQPYDCHWCPAPADLRAIALIEQWRVMARARQLKELLRAEVLIEYSAEHCATMCGKLAEIFRSLASPPVGTDGSGGEISMS